MIVDNENRTIEFESEKEIENLIEDLTEKLKGKVVLTSPATYLMEALAMLTEEQTEEVNND